MLQQTIFSHYSILTPSTRLLLHLLFSPYAATSIRSVLSFGLSVFLVFCFHYVFLSFYVSFSSSFLLWQSTGPVLCCFSGRQPLIHVPIIPSAWGPSGPGTKDASSQASLSRLSALIFTVLLPDLCLFRLLSFACHSVVLVLQILLCHFRPLCLHAPNICHSHISPFPPIFCYFLRIPLYGFSSILGLFLSALYSFLRLSLIVLIHLGCFGIPALPEENE